MKHSSKNYILKPVMTPLPSSKSKTTYEHTPAHQKDRTSDSSRITSSVSSYTPRTENEDDDLYDPYSDFHDGTLKPLEFEQDPWH